MIGHDQDNLFPRSARPGERTDERILIIVTITASLMTMLFFIWILGGGA